MSKSCCLAGFLVCLFLALAIGCSDDDSGPAPPLPPIDGTYRAVSFEEYDTCCTDPLDCDLGPWNEVWNLWTINDTVFAQVYDVDLDECSDPFEIGTLSGNSFRIENLEIYDGPWFDDFGNLLDVDCVETLDAVAVGAYSGSNVEITYVGEQTYSGNCPFDWAEDCAWRGSVSGQRCDPDLCWPCGPAGVAPMSSDDGRSRRGSPLESRRR